MTDRLPNWLYDPRTPEKAVEECLRSQEQRITDGPLPNRRWPNWVYDPRTPDDVITEYLKKLEQ